LGDAQRPLLVCRDVGRSRRLLRCALNSCWDCRYRASGQSTELPTELEEKPSDLHRPFLGVCELWEKGFYLQQNLGWLFLTKLVDAIRLMCPIG